MENRIYFLLSFFCFLFFYQTQAQGISIGAKGGISIPNLSAGGSKQTPVNTGYESLLGPDAALFVQLHLSNAFSVQPMIEYSSQGGKKNGLQAFPTPAEAGIYFRLQQQPVPPYLYGNYKSEVKLSYLMLPLLVKYEIAIAGSPFHVYADAGPFVSLLLTAKGITSGKSFIYLDKEGTQPLAGLGSFSFNSDSNIVSGLNKFNAGVEGHFGVSYTIGKSNIFIEGGGNYGFINIQKDALDGKNNTGAAVVLAGYSYQF